MNLRPGNHPRQGTILIIVSGIAGLLASVAIAFLARVRNDVDDMASVVRETQARIMLNAACSFILESSRVGWEPNNPNGTTVEHLEAHGWIDVRDGSLGPRLNSLSWSTPGQDRDAWNSEMKKAKGRPLMNGRDRPLWDDRKAGRFPMYRMRRPPYAIQLSTGYNPISKKDDYVPYLRYPDPQPVVDNGWGTDPVTDSNQLSGKVSAVNDKNWSAYEQGDKAPVNDSVGLSWFRVLREETGSVFTVTCGAGGTWGFKTFGDAQREGQANLFDNNIKVFESLRNAETIAWYRVEWSPAIPGGDLNPSGVTNTSWKEKWGGQLWNAEGWDNTKYFGINASRPGFPNEVGVGGTRMCMNYCGTISWIQRLRSEPKDW